jgi:hypothetical protein
MPDLKLAKLPDRTPVKHTIVVMPELGKKLREYADLYQKSYGETESIETLIPFMLNTFLEGDRRFAKARKGKAPSDGESAANQISPAKRNLSLGAEIPT